MKKHKGKLPKKTTWKNWNQMGGYKCTEEKELNMDKTDSGQRRMDSFEISGIKSAGSEFSFQFLYVCIHQGDNSRLTSEGTMARSEVIHVELVVNKCHEGSIF